jgi:hypothetical protein
VDRAKAVAASSASAPRGLDARDCTRGEYAQPATTARYRADAPGCTVNSIEAGQGVDIRAGTEDYTGEQ